jgi:SAM-dependent methyltransferase
VDRKGHWEAVYASKAPAEVSWYQERPAMSLRLLDELGATPDSCIIDVGGGDSTFVDALLDRRYRCLTVLDISAAALSRARARLATRANEVTWLEADITHSDLPRHGYDMWHDRAVFHFLTDPRDRRRYADVAAASLRHNGALIIATFAADGPTRCSGLDVRRYSAEALSNELGGGFTLERRLVDVHLTPSGIEQLFTYAVFRRSGTFRG